MSWCTDMPTTTSSHASDAALQKFLFNRTFSGENAESYAKAKEATYTQAQLDAARDEAYQSGLQAGQAAEQASQTQQLSGLVSQLEQKIGLLIAVAEDARAQQSTRICEMSAAIVRKLLPHYVEREGLQEITAILGQVLRDMNREPRLVVRVSESNFDPISAHIKSMSEQHAYAGKVVVLAENTMAASDCLVEWADGGIERDMKTLWQEIDRALAQASLAATTTSDLTHPDKGA